MYLTPVKYNYSDFPRNKNSKVEIVSLHNMIEPTLHNLGTNVVYVDGRELLPGESIVIGASGCIVENSDVELQYRTSENRSLGKLT